MDDVNEFADLGDEITPPTREEMRADSIEKRQTIDHLIRVLNRSGDHQKVFQYAGDAAVITTDRSAVLRRVSGSTGSTEIIRSIPRKANNGLLAGPIEMVSSWVKFYRTPAPGEDREVGMPDWVPKMITDIYGEGLKPLSGIADFPVIGMNDKILAGRIGYDQETRLYIDCQPVPHENYSFDGPQDAYHFLRHEWLGEFNFATEQDAARCLAIPLTLLNRRTRITNGAPVPFITAPTPETGKTILAQVLVEAVTGAPLPASSWDHDNEQERRKMLLAVGMENPAAVLFDNINNSWEVRDSTVERWCTSDQISDRLLGKNENASVSATALLIFTGNNIAAGSSDLMSRSYEIRMERPANAKPFKRANIVGWTVKNRAKIFAALLALSQCDRRKSRYYKPDTRFPSWGELVGEVIQFAANDKTLFERRTGGDHDDVNEDLQMLINAMVKAKGEGMGFTPQEMSDKFSEHMARLDPAMTKETMYDRQNMLVTGNKIPAKHVHRIMRKYEGHMVEGFRLRINKEPHPVKHTRKVNTYKAIAV